MPKFLNTPIWYASVGQGTELYGVGTPGRAFEEYVYLHMVEWSYIKDYGNETFTGGFISLSNQEAAITDGDSLRAYLETNGDSDILHFPGYGKRTSAPCYDLISYRLWINPTTLTNQIRITYVDLGEIASVSSNLVSINISASLFTVVDSVTAVLRP